MYKHLLDPLQYPSFLGSYKQVILYTWTKDQYNLGKFSWELFITDKLCNLRGSHKLSVHYPKSDGAVCSRSAVHTGRRGTPKIRPLFAYFLVWKALKVSDTWKKVLSDRSQQALRFLAFKTKNYEKQCLILGVPPTISFDQCATMGLP